jgi:hypothetical protein
LLLAPMALLSFQPRSFAFAANLDWKEFRIVNRLTIEYPTTWWPISMGLGRIDLVSYKAGAPGVVLGEHQAEIVVRVDLDASGSLDDSAALEYPEDTMLSKKRLTLGTPRLDSCSTWLQVVSKFETGPSTYELYTSFYCDIGGNRVLVRLRNRVGDNRGGEYQQIAEHMAGSVRMTLPNTDGSGCTIPARTTFLAEASQRPELQDLPFDFPSHMHALMFRNRGITTQWISLQWDGPPTGALVLLDCAGHILDALDAGAVETLEEGPTLSAVGQTVVTTAITNTGTGYKLERVDLFGSVRGKIHPLWDHIKHESAFVFANENGEDDVYTWRFEQGGTVIRVSGRRSTFPPSMKHDGNAPPPSLTNLPAEWYCWSVAPQARYTACNIVAPVPGPAS